MGSKESKMKNAFEAIDTSGDKKVTLWDLASYIETDKARQLLKKFSYAEQEEFRQEVLNLGTVIL